MAHPICGDSSKISTYYYCAYNYMCSMTENGATAQYRKSVDTVTGDVCEDVAIKCPC